jgi:hypothetical protein
LELIIRGKTIREDANGNLSLTDIWRLAGSPSAKSPSDWRQLSTADAYIARVAQKLGKTYASRVNNRRSVVYSKSGKGGGTFAHILVATTYAEYLGPRIGLQICRAYLWALWGHPP